MSIIEKIKKMFTDNCPCCSKDGEKKEGECCGAHKSEEPASTCSTQGGEKSESCGCDTSKKEGE